MNNSAQNNPSADPEELSSRLVEAFMKAIERTSSMSPENLYTAIDKIELKYKQSLEGFNRATGAVVKLGRIAEYYAIDRGQLSESFLSAYEQTPEFIKRANEAAESFRRAIEAIAWERLTQSLETARPYMSEEQSETLDAIVAPAAGEDPHTPKRLTLGQWGTILSIILAIIQVILMFRPDPQLDEISDQNEVIIRQQAEQAEILRQLTDTASDICDILETFQQDPDQSEDLADLVGLSSEDLTETPDDDGEPKHLDANTDDSEALDQQDDRDR